MLRIDHATWLRADGTTGTGTLLAAEDGVRLLPEDAAAPIADVVIDGAGGLVVPGLVDPHTHLREPGQGYKEGISNGTRAALAGGVTTVLDMPNNRPPTSTASRLEAKRARFRRKSRVHWGLHVQASLEREALDTARIASVKVYMARSSTDSALNTPARLREIFAAFPRISIHAEDEARFPADATGPHHEVRPREAVRTALRKIEDTLGTLSPPDRPRVILCHVATADELTWLRRMKARGFDLWGEAVPHYTVFTEEDTLRLGGRLHVNPPIRAAADRDAVLAGIADGAIDFAATDHAPHTPAEKASGHPPSGIAGIEWLGPWLISLADRGHIGWPRFLDLGGRSAARCYGFEVAAGVEEGAPADLALLRRGHRRKVVTKARWDPYRDHPMGWTVAATIVRGDLVHLEGTFPGESRGREVYP
ncbi:MAG: amidohydrolase family protein [Pseudomonadota bacterium]